MIELYGKHIRNICQTFGLTREPCDVGWEMVSISDDRTCLAMVEYSDGKPMFEGEAGIDIDSLRLANFGDSELVRVSFDDDEKSPKFILEGDIKLTMHKIEPIGAKLPVLKWSAGFTDIKRRDALRFAKAVNKMSTSIINVFSDDDGVLWLSAEDSISKVEMKISQHGPRNVRTSVDADNFLRMIKASCTSELTFLFADSYPLRVSCYDGLFKYSLITAPRCV